MFKYIYIFVYSYIFLFLYRKTALKEPKILFSNENNIEVHGGIVTWSLLTMTNENSYEGIFIVIFRVHECMCMFVCIYIFIYIYIYGY
jgi:hypothetical protein